MAAPVATSRKVLVVDDDPDTARVLRLWLERERYEILEASDAESGLRAAEREQPDVILLDIRMPGMDGLEAAKLLKNRSSTRSIPVILLTATRKVQAKIQAFDSDVDDYVEKPFSSEEVEARIRAMLRKRDLYLKLEETVQDLRQSNEQLENLSLEDEKTGLYNYRFFRRKLDEEWNRAERYRTPLSLLMLDLDDFKQVNDSLGHPAGDRILRELAALITGAIRVTDVAARYGGEEFAVILPHTGGSRATLLANRICTAVRQFVFLEDERPTRLTVSAGVATVPSSAVIGDPVAFVEAADAALYRAKAEGKDRVALDDGRTPASARRTTPRE